MTKIIRTLSLAAALAVGTCGVGLAQEKAASPSQAQEAEANADQRTEARALEALQRNAEMNRLTPLSVDVVVSRFQGDKKISSLPYSLAVNANALTRGGGAAQLRMGASVPVPSLMAPNGNPTGLVGPMPGPVSYRDIGTNIDCSAQRIEGGFQLLITVEDTSVYANIQDGSTPTVGDMPVFRSFRSTNTLVLRDGQTREFTAATDRVSGEVVRIAVTLRVVK